MAYYLVNKIPTEHLTKELTKEVLAKYTQFCSVNANLENTYEVYILSGASISQYEFYAEQIVEYVLRNLKVVILEIVIDFVKDEKGVIYFLGVKSFKALDQSKIYRVSIKEYLQNEENTKKIYKTIKCGLCLLSYQQSKINKVVSLKILVNVKDSLSKRKIYMFPHIDVRIFQVKLFKKSTYNNNTMTCRVCDLCYRLIMTEHQLHEVSNIGNSIIVRKINWFMYEHSNSFRGRI